MKSLQTLKKEAWQVYSLWRRMSVADNNELAICFSCGRIYHWKQFDLGHYIPKSICGLYLFVHPINCQLQCTYCNRYMHGNLSQYALALQRKYGAGILKRLDKMRLKYKGFIYAPKDYERMIKLYRGKVAKLKNLNQ